MGERDWAVRDMRYEELIQRLCDEGEESIRLTCLDPTDPRRRGGLLGFKIVRAIKDPAEFPATLDHRAAVEAEMQAQNEDEDTYWAYRWATLQVEFVWEILKAGMKVYPEAEAAAEELRKAGIVGAKGRDGKEDWGKAEGGGGVHGPGVRGKTTS